MNRRWIATIALVLGTTLSAGLASACGDDDDGENVVEDAATTVASAVTGAGTSVAGDDGGGGSAPAVTVTLQEFEISPQPDSAAAGEVTFRAAEATRDEQTGLTYYVVRVRLGEDQLALLGDNVIMMPGMPAEVYIATGGMTVAEYLMKPLAAQLRQVWREQ